MSKPPPSVSPEEYHQIVGYLESHCPQNPHVYSECMAIVRSFDRRIDEWDHKPIVLPHGAELEEYSEPNGDVVHSIQWPGLALRRPPIDFRSPAVAATVVWTVYMLRRPWSIDAARLTMLVNDPPIHRAHLVGLLVAARCSTQVFTAASRLLDVWAYLIRQGTKVVDEDTPDPLKELMQQSLDRLTLTINHLSDLLEVKELRSSLGQELFRWRWMCLDYFDACNSPLGETLEALARDDHKAVEDKDREDEAQIREDIDRWRRIEAFTGILLGRAAMLDQRSPDRPLVHFIDPLATRATGSLAWWCRLASEATEAPIAVDNRLPPDAIEDFVAMAREGLDQLDTTLVTAIDEMFPVLHA